jgi:co-chaperonin GroES (HSP10)
MKREPFLEPLNGHIVVRRHTSGGETSGRHGAKLVLPDGVHEQGVSQKATVIGTWMPRWYSLRRPRVAEGDTVFMPRYCGQEFTLDNGSKIVFMEEEDLLGAVREPVRGTWRSRARRAARQAWESVVGVSAPSISREEVAA